MVNSSEIKKIEFKIGEISNRAMRQIQTTTEAIAFIYHAALNYQPTEFIPLETDSLPIIVQESCVDNCSDAVRKRSINWLFKKAFEEFIVGLTESLCEAHKFVKLAELSKISKETKKMTLEEINAIIDTINSRPHKLPFPVLLEEVELGLQTELPFKSELVSINNVRNCLVHRNAFVTKSDIRETCLDGLQLKYIDLVTYYEKNEGMIEMKWEHKRNSFLTNKLQFTPTFKSVTYKLGEQVLIDSNIFNGVSYTCVLFLQNLQFLAITHNIENINSPDK